MTAESVRTGVGATIASWQLRVIVAIPVLVMLLTVVVAFAPPIWLVVVLILAATATIGNPRSHAATVLMGFVVLAAFGADAPGWWLPVLVLTVHATHVGAALAAVVPATADIEIDALRPSFRRFVTVQAGAQALVVVILVMAL